MPYSKYLPEHMGSIALSPAGPFVAGSYAELTLVYTAGTFGIDDTGMLKISWRTTSDMSKPQFDKPQAANFTTVEASNGAKLEVWFDRTNIRPWANTIMIRVGRGYLRAGDTLTIRMGDRRQGSPGYRLQTNVEAQVEFRSSVDAFATYEFCELKHPTFDLVAGHEVDDLAVLPERERRAARRVLAHLRSCACRGVRVLACEDGDDGVGLRGALQRERDRGPRTTGGAAADRVDDQECGALLAFQERIDVSRRAKFLGAELRELLTHRGDHVFRIGHRELRDEGTNST